jgi:hypothetical protein
MSKVVVNGKTFEIPNGVSVSIVNNKVYINNELWTDIEATGPVKLIVDGDIGTIMTEGSAEINGTVNGHVDVGGSLKVYNGGIQGNVHVGGSVKCEKITGGVVAGGSVHCN